MRTNLQKATHLASSLLLAAGLGLFSGSVQARSTGKKAPGRKAAGSTAHPSSHKKGPSRSKRRERGQQAPTPERITEIQQALAKDGAYTGKPNGQWDESTAEAMRKFQESHGLSPTGKLDARSLQQLGLGSPIAGVARPLPSTTTSRLTAPSTSSAQPHH